jgi:ribosomal-protein-alanine N-acetyltransferase
MSIFEYFPRFDLGDVHLREIRISDSAAYHRYMNNDEVKEFLTQDNIPITLDAAAEDLRYWSGVFTHRRSIYWGIATTETDELIGTIGFNVWNRVHNRVDISYDLDQRFWGKGIMGRAMSWVVKFALEEMNVVRIQATVALGNVRSVKLLERSDFQQEGILRKYEIIAGKYTDYYMYALVR